jgi:hypothetical protein
MVLRGCQRPARRLPFESHDVAQRKTVACRMRRSLERARPPGGRLGAFQITCTPGTPGTPGTLQKAAVEVVSFGRTTMSISTSGNDRDGRAGEPVLVTVQIPGVVAGLSYGPRSSR